MTTARGEKIRINEQSSEYVFLYRFGASAREPTNRLIDFFGVYCKSEIM